MIEHKLEALTAAINALVAVLTAAGASTVVPATVVTQAPVAPVAPPPVQIAPVVAAPAPVAVAPAPVMPPPPVFLAPPVVAPVVAAPVAPFGDPKGLIDYVMSSYKTLGPQKGAAIQGVLSGLGVANINDVKPEQYAALWAGIEALKV